jgi:N-acetylmuramoyl-L-alanine amidase
MSQLLRLGDEGDHVATLRSRLAGMGLLDSDDATPGPADSAPDARSRRFDADLERAVRAFQQQRGLTADGIVGPGTRAALADAAWVLGDRVLEHLPRAMASGDDVIALQRRLLDLGFAVGRVDGLYDAETAAGVAEFQRNVGLHADGVFGAETMTALLRLRPIVQGGNPNAMRAAERIREAGPHLDDKLVVLDVVPFSADVPGLDPVEAERLSTLGNTAVEAVASLVEEGLSKVGGRSTRTTPGPERERAWETNTSGGAVCVSLVTDASADPDAGGLSTYYYGIDAHDIRSTAGERFAGLVHREILARTPFGDGGRHARFWDLLRMTRMPAVRIDLGCVTCERDASALGDPEVLSAVARAVVVAVQRVYLAPEDDSPTGLLDLDDLRRLREQQDRREPPGPPAG